MKISNSKKELARIISENGGWCDWAKLAVFGPVSKKVRFSRHHEKPVILHKSRGLGQGWEVAGQFDSWMESESIHVGKPFPNWHQTILSREEYFHLYPAPDADGWIGWKGGECPCPFDSGVARMRDGTEIAFGERNAYNWRHDESCPRGRQIVAYRPRKPGQAKPEIAPAPVVEAKPTIEQLAADYRNAKDYADRKQEEADDAKADAEAKLAELVATGKAHGLVLSVVASGSELVITDWRDLQLGDIIEYVDGDIKDKIGMTGPVVEFAPDATDGMHVRLACDNGPNKGRLGWPRKFRFIRRP